MQTRKNQFDLEMTAPIKLMTIANMQLPRFTEETPVQKRAEACAPFVNDWILKFESGEVLDGVEAFQNHLMEEIGMSLLGEE